MLCILITDSIAFSQWALGIIEGHLDDLACKKLLPQQQCSRLTVRTWWKDAVFKSGRLALSQEGSFEAA